MIALNMIRKQNDCFAWFYSLGTELRRDISEPENYHLNLDPPRGRTPGPEIDWDILWVNL